LSQAGNIQSDPYLYPDTSVLRNLADIRDANRLNQFESDHFFARLLELHENPIRGSFDSDHLRHIHKYVFQDVYAWAGEFRSVPIAKGNSFFARPEHIRAELQKLFHQLAASNICEGTIPRNSANAPHTTLARSTPCILFARETDERNVNSFESWL
jgi:cell filamentation protein